MIARLLCMAGCVAALALAGCGRKTGASNAGAAAPTSAVAAAPVSPGAPGSPPVNDGPPVDGDVTLSAPATALAGSSIAVTFTGPANASDYIDIAPRGDTQTSGELSYVYVNAAAKGARLRVLTTPGEYDVRYILDLKDGGRKVKAVSPLTITPATATLTVPPTALGAEPLSIEWTGPAGDGDYVDVVPQGYTDTSGEIAYAYTSAGSPAMFSAPGPSGDYTVRYVLEGPGGRRVLTTAPLSVTAPEATLEAPDTAKTNATVAVVWTGPKRSGDYVDLVKKGYTQTSGEISYFYTDRQTASELKMPIEPGEYEIRYVMEAPKQRVVLARRAISVD
ncbi:MAG: hypothetical protein GC155_08715 [Alphaproteobacteria bacterium]|nr:hypothetical protein [Alphaproteobacteria bacterium]